MMQENDVFLSSFNGNQTVFSKDNSGSSVMKLKR